MDEMNDDTITGAIAGKGPEELFKEYALRHISELESSVKFLETRVQTLEEYQEPLRQIQDQIKKWLIKAFVLGVVLLLLGGGSVMLGS